MLFYRRDDICLDWIDPHRVRMHPQCRVDGERIQAYRQELRGHPGASLQPLLVIDGVCHDGNHRLAAYRYEDVRRALAVVVRRAASEADGEGEGERVIGFITPQADEDEGEGEDEDDDGDT